MNIESYGHTQTKKLSPDRWGFELEIESGNLRRGSIADDLDPINKNSQQISIKEDGSLSDGFEIVSRPLPVGDLKKLITSVCEKLPEGTKSYATRTCGFHLHVGIELFQNSMQLAQFLRVFQSNTVWSNLIEPVSQRPENRWCRRIRSVRRTGILFSTGNRYHSVNLTNPYTVEIRCFRVNTRADRLLKNVELVELFLLFSKSPPSKKRVLHDRLKKFYQSRIEQFPNLEVFLREKKAWIYKEEEKITCA